jgi:hypothetical protein
VKHDTDPNELKPVLDAVAKLQVAVKLHEQTIGGAIAALRTQILQQHHAVQSRIDHLTREMRQVRDVLKLPPLEPATEPNFYPDAE